MGRINQGIKAAMLRLIEYRWEYHRTKGLYEEIEERKKVWEDVILTDAQIQEIKSIYGENIDTRWHRYYQAFTGRFDAKYLPEPVFSPLMEKKLNPVGIALELEDKIRLPITYGNIPEVVVPKTIVANASGIYYDADGCVMDCTEANRKVKTYLEANEGAVVKPIRDSYGGEGVALLKKETFEQIPLEKNFVVQELVVNQEDIRTLNPYSLNTFRVMTYICDNQYWTAPIALRMGTTTALTDNISAGGITIGVKDDGTLCSEAYTEGVKEKYLEHPMTHIQFKGYKLKNIDKVINAAIECHKRTPHMAMASWDIALNDREEPVLIEVNLTSQSVCFPQYTHGESLFGKNTMKMLKYLEK